MTAANAHTPICPRMRSDMTPCIVGDGSDAASDDGHCVGCGVTQSLIASAPALLDALQRIVSKYDHMRANYDQGDWRLVLQHWRELADEARTALSQAQKGTP